MAGSCEFCPADGGGCGTCETLPEPTGMGAAVRCLDTDVPGVVVGIGPGSSRLVDFGEGPELVPAVKLAPAVAVGGDRPDTVTELRRLLMEWERFGRTMSDAGVIAVPGRLLGRTVGLLDATSV